MNPGYAEIVPDGQRINRDRLKPRVKELMRPNNLRAAGEITLQWTLIAIFYAGVRYFNHPVAYLAGMVLMATRQHALLIVMHDAMHGALFSKRWVNELAGDYFLGIPINFTLRGIRAHHLAHHRHTGSDKDPDLHAGELLPGVEGKALPAQIWTYLQFFARRAVMYNGTGRVIALAFPRLDPKARYTTAERAALLTWVALLAALITWAGVWVDVLVLWILPYYFILPAFIILRGRPEHDMPYSEEVRVSRFVDATLLERFFICPNFINYHSQHHLYPGVPSYNLPKLHQLLMEDPVFRERAIITPGYWGWLREVIARRRNPVTPPAAPAAAPQAHVAEELADLPHPTGASR